MKGFNLLAIAISLAGALGFHFEEVSKFDAEAIKGDAAAVAAYVALAPTPATPIRQVGVLPADDAGDARQADPGPLQEDASGVQLALLAAPASPAPPPPISPAPAVKEAAPVVNQSYARWRLLPRLRRCRGGFCSG